MTVYTPPMGYNTWNTFGDKIDEKIIVKIVKIFDVNLIFFRLLNEIVIV